MDLRVSFEILQGSVSNRSFSSAHSISEKTPPSWTVPILITKTHIEHQIGILFDYCSKHSSIDSFQSPPVSM